MTLARRCVAQILICAAIAASLASSGEATAPLRVIRLVSIQTSNRSVDVAPKGLSAGDHATWTARVLNGAPQFGKPKGAVVGSGSGTTLLTSSRIAKATGVIKLPGGLVEYKGTVSLEKLAGRVAVIRGTGAYARATGSMHYDTSNGDKTSEVYRLAYH